MTDDPLVITRVVVLSTLGDGNAMEALAGTPGVLAVKAVKGGKAVEVTYDLKCLNLDSIEHVLTGSGAQLADGAWNAIGRQLAKFTETNTLSNSRIVHRCCNKPLG